MQTNNFFYGLRYDERIDFAYFIKPQCYTKSNFWGKMVMLAFAGITDKNKNALS
jgi:hypothetical protein